MNILFDGNGFYSIFTKMEIHRKGDMNYFCFWIPFIHSNAKRLGYIDKPNYDPIPDDNGYGRLILTFPEFRNTHRNMHQLRSQPDSKVFLVESSWEGNDTPFSRRREDYKNVIRAKIERIYKLNTMRENRQMEFIRAIKEKTKEIDALKKMSGVEKPKQES